MVPRRAGRNPIPENPTIRRGQRTARRHLPGRNLGPKEAGLGMAGDQSRPVVTAAKGGCELRQVQSGSCRLGVVTAETFGCDQFGSPRLQVWWTDLGTSPARQRQPGDGQEDDDGSVSLQERDLPAILHQPPIQSRFMGSGVFQAPVLQSGNRAEEYGAPERRPSSSPFQRFYSPSVTTISRSAGRSWRVCFSPLGQWTSSDSTRVVRPNPKLTR